MDNVRIAEAARNLLEAAREEVTLDDCTRLAWAARTRNDKTRPQGMVLWAVLNAFVPNISTDLAEEIIWSLFVRGAVVMVPWFIQDSAGKDVDTWARWLAPQHSRDAFRLMWRIYLNRLHWLSFGALGAAVGRFAEWSGCTDEEFEWLCDQVRTRATEGESHYKMRYEEPALEGVGARRWRTLWFRAFDDARRLGHFARSARVDELGREATAARRLALNAVKKKLRHSREVVLNIVQQFIG